MQLGSSGRAAKQDPRAVTLHPHNHMSNWTHLEAGGHLPWEPKTFLFLTLPPAELRPAIFKNQLRQKLCLVLSLSGCISSLILLKDLFQQRLLGHRLELSGLLLGVWTLPEPAALYSTSVYLCHKLEAGSATNSFQPAHT